MLYNLLSIINSPALGRSSVTRKTNFFLQQYLAFEMGLYVWGFLLNPIGKQKCFSDSVFLIECFFRRDSRWKAIHRRYSNPISAGRWFERKLHQSVLKASRQLNVDDQRYAGLFELNASISFNPLAPELINGAETMELIPIASPNELERAWITLLNAVFMFAPWASSFFHWSMEGTILQTTFLSFTLTELSTLSLDT